SGARGRRQGRRLLRERRHRDQDAPPVDRGRAHQRGAHAVRPPAARRGAAPPPPLAGSRPNEPEKPSKIKGSALRRTRAAPARIGPAPHVARRRSPPLRQGLDVRSCGGDDPARSGAPYPPGARVPGGTMDERNVFYERLTWPQVREAARADKVILIPF